MPNSVRSTNALWQTPTGPFALDSVDVHVWLADLNLDGAALLSLRQTLSSDELARADRFHAAVHRDHYVAGRGILRNLLSRYLGAPAHEFSFLANATGKPSLAVGTNTADLRFNLSHSHGRALFAFALHREIGVDLECIRDSVSPLCLAERFFSPAEFAAISKLPAAEQLEAFFHCWTRKEAYVKALGGGLSIGLSSFTVPLDAGSQGHLAIIGEGDEPCRWSLRPLSPGSGYVGAVVAEGTDWSPRLWQWS